MKKFGSYGICLALLLMLFGAAVTFAQENVDSSALVDQWETECLIDELPSVDEGGDGPDRHLTFTSRTFTKGNTAVQRQIERTADVLGEHKVGGPSDEVADLDRSRTEESCVQSGETGISPRCFFPTHSKEFVVPTHFTASARDESDESETKPPPRDRFHWKSALIQSMVIQGLQHAYALGFQEKMRVALKGPFFKDYINSLKGLAGWDDGNRFFTNYVAHPAQGAMTGFIFVQNHDRVKRQKFGESKQYWMDRLTALAWSAAWSTNWELGPISQSSIGNLGLKGGMGYVDLVITPTVGTIWLVTEEAVDRYIIRHTEGKNFLLKIVLRTLLNPMRAVANALRLKEPWYRDRPFGH